MERIINYSGGIININIKDSGVYSLGVDSSTGKSHLYHILDSIDDNRVLALTYDKRLDYINILSNISDDTDIIYIDRFDMILTADIASVLMNLKNKYIILDFKDDNYSSILDAKVLLFSKMKGDFYLYG